MIGSDAAAVTTSGRVRHRALTIGELDIFCREAGPAGAPTLLLYDYQSNIALYPAWQAWLREHHPPLLLPWGRHDEFFPETGARAYLADVPDAELHLLDTGHFALDDHVDAIAALIVDFVARHARQLA
jgi:pimeloyl-ACP methyl ester carboxylesterase